MKKTYLIALITAVASWHTLAADLEQEPQSTNRLNYLAVSARFGFNISAKFKGSGPLPSLVSPRLTPDGNRYNYDDGYILTDSSGNAGNQTWYWGYDESSSQVSGNAVLLSRSSVIEDTHSKTLDGDPSYGAELLYRRELGVFKEHYHYGLEAAANYQNVSISGSTKSTAQLTRVTDAYPFVSQTEPPVATLSAPYQGSFQGPGFVIGDKPISSTSTAIPGVATLTGHRELDTDLFGFRVGPYLAIPLGEKVNISISGGFAVGLLDASGSWSETVVAPGVGSGTSKGSGSDFDALLGGYAGVSITYQFNPRWSLLGGAQWQSLADYKHSFGGQKAELKLSNGIFTSIGVGFSF